ncbi:beta-1,3-galactosyltransferase brn-like [Argopecten irradians]|uniref:beta-1,3-galactosyltransferase brn-like n=1 Tax=Argopecten irradians TaxID=31199 RepID=UPI00371569C3
MACRRMTYRRLKTVCFSIVIFVCFVMPLTRMRTIYCLNFSQNYPLKEYLPFRTFHYPLDIDFNTLEENVEKGTVDIDPINVFPYSYKKPLDDICDSAENTFLLFMIKSAPGNFDRRKAIRETWTNKTYFPNYVIRHVFLLAGTTNETIHERVSQEKQIHHDIVEMTYIDNYYRNTDKTTGGINWCVQYCPTAKFVSLVDDDFYVATDLVLEYLEGLPQDIYRSLFVGRVGSQDPQRCPDDKWYMSLKDYKFDLYPPFVAGGAILMSMEFVKRLHIAIPYTKPFKFDDVFLAIVVYKLGVSPIDHPEIHITPVSYKDVENFQTALMSHGYEDPNELRTAWYYHQHLDQLMILDIQGKNGLDGYDVRNK